MQNFHNKNLQIKVTESAKPPHVSLILKHKEKHKGSTKEPYKKCGRKCKKLTEKSYGKNMQKSIEKTYKKKCKNPQREFFYKCKTSTQRTYYLGH